MVGIRIQSLATWSPGQSPISRAADCCTEDFGYDEVLSAKEGDCGSLTAVLLGIQSEFGKHYTTKFAEKIAATTQDPDWAKGIRSLVLRRSHYETAVTTSLIGRTFLTCGYDRIPRPLRSIEDCVSAAVADARSYLAASGRSLKQGQALALGRQFDVLFSDIDDLIAAAVVPSIRSLEHLIWFLNASRPSKFPSLSLSQSGSFVVSWTPRHPGAKLTLTFGDDGQVNWVAVDLSEPFAGSGFFSVDESPPPDSHFTSWAFV
ncbi:MAG: hypothetical protein ACLPIC_00960 [Rhodoblastus sp.]|uniref:hypothetical protein n=1 Tax=Rhodoblastus sp. TaxID=1962975 RepID=UPI003F98E3C2